MVTADLWLLLQLTINSLANCSNILLYTTHTTYIYYIFNPLTNLPCNTSFISSFHSSFPIMSRIQISASLPRFPAFPCIATCDENSLRPAPTTYSLGSLPQHTACPPNILAPKAGTTRVLDRPCVVETHAHTCEPCRAFSVVHACSYATQHRPNARVALASKSLSTVSTTPFFIQYFSTATSFSLNRYSLQYVDSASIFSNNTLYPPA